VSQQTADFIATWLILPLLLAKIKSPGFAFSLTSSPQACRSVCLPVTPHRAATLRGSPHEELGKALQVNTLTSVTPRPAFRQTAPVKAYQSLTAWRLRSYVSISFGRAVPVK